MSEERTKEQQQLQELSMTVEAMRSGQDIENIENMRRRALQDIISAGTVSNPGDENETTNVPTGGGNVDHNKQYDKRVLVDIDGTDYYIGLYLV